MCIPIECTHGKLTRFKSITKWYRFSLGLKKKISNFLTQKKIEPKLTLHTQKSLATFSLFTCRVGVPMLTVPLGCPLFVQYY